MKHYLRNRWTWLLFIVALGPRLFDLDQFLISDENTNIFLAGSAVIQAVLRGDFRQTYWHFYPGVTMSWADGIGLAGQWLLTQASSQSFAGYINTINIGASDIRSLLVAVRLPYALLTALFIPAVYHLLMCWFDNEDNDDNGDRAGAEKINGTTHYLALTAALLIAFDPFFLAHSRVVHGDAPVSVFMVLSILALFLYLRDGGRRLHIFSAVMGSLAALTKAPGQVIAPLVVAIIAAHWVLMSRRRKNQGHFIFDWALGKKCGLDIVLWGGIAFLVMVILWPAMWVDPIGTIRQMLAETFGKVNEGHLVFFFGRPTLDPGPWFYPYVIPFRLTPVTSLGALFSLGMGGYFVFGRGPKRQGSRGAGGQRSRGVEGRRSRDGIAAWGGLFGSPERLGYEIGTLLLLLWFFVLALWLFGNVSPKKQDRYLLPLFPVLDIVAALGWFGAWRLAAGYFRGGRRLIFGGLMGLVVMQLVFILPHHPYYLAYFNPLMGGLPRAVETTLVGWGEGMEQAAHYLNQKPAAETLYVAATPSQTLLPFFKGQGENFYTNDIAMRADYVVIYRAQQQRLAPSPEIVRHYLAQTPEHVIEIDHVPYAWIYPNKRLIFSDVPEWGTLTNVGFDDQLRLAGYHIERQETTLDLDLFWHALPGIEGALGPCHEQQVEHIKTTVCPRLDYTISARLLGPDGTQVVQHDSWPAAGLLPTSLWRPNDYIQDHHSLALPPDLSAGDYHLAVVVYDNQTGTVLGGPVEVAVVAF